MKKLFLGAAIAVSSLTFAQEFGIKGGLNVSNLSRGADLEESSSKIGFNGGVFMNAPLAEDFNIQPELLYNNLGSKTTWTNPVTNSKYDTSWHLNYLALPVMFQYRATPAFYLEAGPEFGFLLSSKATNSNSGDSSTRDLNTDNLNSFNFGAGIGAGYDITPNFGINARYVAGFTDIFKDGVNNGDPVKNNNFQAGVYYKFK